MSRFAIKRLDQVDIVPLGNLVKADAIHVMAEATEALARIEEQGSRAYELARERGRAEGIAEGRQAVGQLLTETATAAHGYWNRAERRLVAIVVDAVRRIIGEIDETGAVVGMIRQLLGELRDEGKIQLFVSPAQHREIEKRIVDLQNRHAGVSSVEVMEDAAIDDDACRVETELGVVETGIEAQIEALRVALEAYFAENETVVKAGPEYARTDSAGSPVC